MDGDDADDQCPGRLLQQAAIYNNVGLMESLLQGPERRNINAQDSYGRTALYTSITNNSFECMERLLLAGADTNISCGLQCGGMSPLHAAALDNKDRFVRLLLTYNADVNRLDASGESPLALALTNRSQDCVEIINEQLELNARLKASFENDFVAACKSGNVEVAEGLLHGTILSRDDALRLADEHGLLRTVCEFEFLDVCEFLLDIGARVEVDPSSGHNPFHVACINGYGNVARAILRCWPDQAEAQTSDGQTAIHLASIHGHVHVVRLLYEFLLEKAVASSRAAVSHSSRVATMNVPDARRRTPLHLAVINNRPDVVAYILNVLVPSASDGCDDRNWHSGDTLAPSGVPRRTMKVDRGVCSRQPSKEASDGADVDVEDDEGRTPFHYAVLGDSEATAFFDLAAVLLQHKADPNRPFQLAGGGAATSSPLREAFRRSDRALVSLLLRHGAKDDDLRTIGDAMEAGDDEMIGVMIQYHSYLDAEYKPNHAALAEAQHRADADADLSRSVSYGASGITISWHALRLKKIVELWIVKACTHQLNRNHLCADWVVRNQAAALVFVTRVNVSENGIEVLPEFLWQLPSLRSIDASSNKISTVLESRTVPMEDGDLVYARSAKDFVLNCPYLEEISLCKNQLATVPCSFFQMPALKKLNLSHNAIECLPFDMWTSTSLLELNLAHNNIKTLPFQTEDKIFPTKIQSAPVFTLIESLKLTDNQDNSSQVSDMPAFHRNDATAPLSNGVADNGLLPKHVNRWQDWVSVRPADELDGGADPKAECHSQLQELNVSHNKLGDLPSALPCLAPHLEKLIVSHNRLRQVGCAAIYPASLKFLDLSYNEIASSQASIANAIDIAKALVQSSPTRNCYSPYWMGSSVPSTPFPKSRSISGSFPTAAWNVVSCRHRCHLRLDRLKALKLNNNKIRKFVFFYEVNEDSILSSVESSRTTDTKSQLRSTKRLSQISDISDRKRSLVLYPNLTSLDLSHNELVCLTPDICELTQLAELKVSNNRIRELPPEMGLMRKLWNVDFSNCPVADSLQSLLGDKVRKTSAVLGYLKSIRDEAVPFNRMKLMFVGIQGIGKTSLLNQLRDRRTRNSHWMDRMGHNTQGRDQRGDNISTVGVDIGDLEIHGPNGKVIFSTWDFGGQKEYYATHQYFLSKRSLYLVVWKVTDGESGVNEILQWLINIQARVPGSPVIIVGTHRDLLPRRNREESLGKIDELIRKKYMPLSEPDKLGLPRVLGHIEVSCKNSFATKNYIQELRSLIWKVVSEEHLPGVRGTLLLDQKVPARYLHLQQIVETLAKERKAQHKDPVLHADQYKQMVIAKMEEMYKVCFQDMSELSQATQFLHENGVLLHYDEVHLQDVYFLDPQWLCDMLANVITIHEINRLAKSGVMKTDDVQVLFKGVAFRADDMKTYMINLLQKFEVALLWDHDHLLIPSLLPTESDVVRGIPGSCVMIPVDCGLGASCQSSSCQPHEQKSHPVRESQIISPRPQQLKNSSSGTSLPVKNISNPAVSLVRLYLMSYFPCGFWPRLITRLLGDRAFIRLALALYRTDSLSAEVNASIDRLKSRTQWQCWQTGLELKLSDITILRLKEVSRGSSQADGGSVYGNRSLLIRREDDCLWNAVDSRSLSVLEVFVPNEILRVRVSELSHVVVDPETQTTAALLAAAVDRIDTLLEDWYPDIGMRFTQDTKGTYLITRLVPCIRCLFRQDDALQELPGGWACVNTTFETGAPSSQSLPASPDHGLGKIIDVPSGTSLPQRSGSPPVRKTVMSSSCDSGPVKEKSSRHFNKNRDDCRAASSNINSNEETKLCSGIYCFLFEACIQTVQANKVISCPVHGNLGPCFTASKTGHVRTSHIAPDVIFQDVGEDRLVDPDAINLDRFLGRGAFGAVFGGTIVNRVTGDAIPVAMKVLQPVKPTPDASASQLHRYRAEKAKWDCLPIKYNCEAYLNARKELGIMLSLNHPSIVPLLGFSVTPLGLILSLAPQGDLNGRLQNYKRAGAGVPVYVIRDIIVKVASALQYLHSLQVIYRDLKSENVLVWSLPPPHSEDECLPVDVKLADYGVCRVVLPVGTKGFAGTPPFMAPEIIQHNGDEAYTEKVDCYSFGMFVYELLLLRLPFEDAGTVNGSNINLKSHVMSGGRPTITSKETVRQTGLLDLMTLCWSHDPSDRPSMREIVEFARRSEFCAVFNAVEIEDADIVLSSSSARRPLGIDTVDAQSGIGYSVSRSSECDVWLSLSTKDHLSGSLVVCTYRDQNCLRIKKLRSNFAVISVMCVTNTAVWCASSGCDVYVFRLHDYEEIGKLSVAPSRQGTSIRCMLYSGTEDFVYVFLDDGDAVVCPATLEVSCTGTPALKEYAGNGRPVHCVAIIATVGSSVELWCGQGSGKIRVWNLESEPSIESSDRLLNHFNTEEVHVVTYHLVTSCSDSLTLYSYVYPGTTVYCWDTSSKSLLARIDLIGQVLSKFSASRTFKNSLKSTATKWQVTCMNVIDEFLYIGTTGGCLCVVNRHSLTPLTLCQPHGDGFPNIRSILPLSFPPETLCQWEASLSSAEGCLQVFPQSRSLFVTVGRGYRDLAAGVMSKYAAEKSNEGIYLVAWSGDEWPSTAVDTADIATEC